MNNFICLEVALLMVSAARRPIEKLAMKDRSLADQLRRCSASVPLNIAEGRARVGKDRPQHYRTAAGSAAEVTACLRVALGLGYLDSDEVADTLSYADRVRAMLWKLTH
jgi:four helix bundle protein